MKRKLLTFLFVIGIFMFIALALAVDFTPQGDINLRGVYQIKNATNITAEYFCNDTDCYTISQFTDDTTIGNCSIDGSCPNIIYYSNESLSVNSSDYWDNLGSINATQMENSGGVLNILVSWINAGWCALTGCSISGDLNVSGNVNVTGNVTATYFFGDGSEITNIGVETASALTVSGKAAENIAKGQPVYASGAVGANVQFSLCDNTIDGKTHVLGLSAETKTTGQTILIRVGGQLDDFNTTAWSEGDCLYLSTSGSLTNSTPTSGSIVHVAHVEDVNANTGSVMLNIRRIRNKGAPADVDLFTRFGDDIGVNKIEYRNYSNEMIAYIDSNGSAYFFKSVETPSYCNSTDCYTVAQFLSDSDTTYTAGSNLSLVGTEFAVNTTSLKDWLDTIYQAIGNYLTTATNFGGEVSGNASNIILDNDALDDQYVELTDLPLANQTTPYCGNITGATSDLCTLTDTDTVDGNASSICSGTTTYLDGEGNCDDISGVYIDESDEANLNVNSSSFWDNLDSPLDSWLSTYNTTYDAKVSANSSFTQALTDTLYADSSVTGDNKSWNESYADDLYADTKWGYNMTNTINYTSETYSAYDSKWSSTYNATYATSVGNASWNESHANTLYADISAQGNASWNESLATTLYSGIEWDYNQSGYWDNMNTINITQMEDNNGVLNILVSWLEGLFISDSDEVNLNVNSSNYWDNLDSPLATWLSTYNATYDKWAYNMTDGYEANTDTNASTICSGTTTYLDGEGNCDDISSVYEPISAAHFDATTLNITCFDSACNWYMNATDSCMYWPSGGKDCGAA